MADKSGRSSGGNRRQSSRLQRRAPASIEISPAGNWNVAIPLLSPLVQSPTSPKEMMKLMMNSNSNSNKEESTRRNNVAETKTKVPVPVVYKKWQHPAAPFCYESTKTQFVPFVCTDSRR